MSRLPSRRVLLLSLLFTSIASPVGAWLSDGTPVCLAPNDQNALVSAPDDVGGILMVWQDNRNGVGEVYAQRFDDQGNALWTADGVALRTGFLGQFHPWICGDGTGGAWVVWRDYINPYGNIQLQHLDATGSPTWAPVGGAPIATGDATHGHLRPVCATDGAGGVIVAWVWRFEYTTFDIKAQRVDSSGTVRWAPEGVHVGDEIGEYEEMDIYPNTREGGILLGWQTGPVPTFRGRVQWVALSGTPQWNGTFGEGLGIIAGNSRVRVTLRDRPDSGLYVAYSWVGGLFGQTNLSVSSYTNTGYEHWSTVITSSDGTTTLTHHPGGDPRIVPDGLGACVVVWDRLETPGGAPAGIYAQKLDRSSGAKLWNGGDRVLVSDQADGNYRPDVAIQYGMWSTFVTWVGDDGGGPRLKYAAVERTNGWPSTEVLVPGGYTDVRPTIVTQVDAIANPLIAWVDERLPAETNIYCMGLGAQGELLGPNLVVTNVEIEDEPSQIGVTTDVTVTVKNIGTLDAGPFALAYYMDLSSPPAVGQLPNGPILEHTGLAVDDSVSWTFDALSLFVTTWDSYAFVDFRDDVDELDDEGDNIMGPISHRWWSRPNLTITEFRLSDTNPQTGDLVHASITIKNVGTENSGTFKVGLYEDLSSPPTLSTPEDHFALASSIAPGDSVVWTTPVFTNTGVGTWNAYAFADNDDDVEEYDEDDNIAGPEDIAWILPNQSGWPQAIGGECFTSPAITSLPATPPGLRSVLVGSTDGKVYAWDGLGNELTGWPYDSGAPVRSSPAVGNVAGSLPAGDLEVVFGNDNGKVVCVDAAGNFLWGFSTGSPVSATPVLADLTGDARLEVVVGNEAGELYVLDNSGLVLPGWPVSVGRAILASPAVGQMDGTGDLEIVVIGTDSRGPSAEVAVYQPSGVLYSLSWPVTVSSHIVSSPALGNVAGTDDLEIVVGDTDGNLHLWTLGAVSGPFPVLLDGPIVSSVALANLDLDESGVEIVVATQYETGGFPVRTVSSVYALNSDGNTLSGWPRGLGNLLLDSHACAGPVVWSTPNGKDTYVAIGSANRRCYVFDKNGNDVDGYSMTVASSIHGSAAVSDIDADGMLEIVVPGSNEIDCFEVPGNSYSPAGMQWPMFGHDPKRTRAYGYETVTGIGPLEGPPPRQASTLMAPHPNPFNPSVTIPYFLSSGGEASITIYDVAGRRIRQLLSGYQSAGENRIIWNGTDTRGRNVASGVYLVELAAKDGTDTRRLTLVR